MVSRLELSRLRDVPAFLVTAIRLRRAISGADGAIGLGLRAQPLSRTFWTLSAWTDEKALQAYTETSLHRRIVENFRPRMAASEFRFYTESAHIPPRWEDALPHLTTQAVIVDL